MKLSLKQKRWITLGIGIAGAILAVLDAVSHRGSTMGFVGLTLLAVAFLISLFLLRCPHRGKWLGDNGGKHCQHCSEALDW